MDAEERLRLEISAAIASLRYFWPWVLVAALPRCSAIVEVVRKLRRFNAEAQRFAEIRREFFFSALLRVALRLCVKAGLAAALPRCVSAV